MYLTVEVEAVEPPILTELEIPNQPNLNISETDELIINPENVSEK